MPEKRQDANHGGNTGIGSDNLPRQTKAGETTITITYSNWNQPATIEAPK